MGGIYWRQDFDDENEPRRRALSGTQRGARARVSAKLDVEDKHRLGQQQSSIPPKYYN